MRKKSNTMEIKQLPVHDKNTLCGILEYENDWKK